MNKIRDMKDVTFRNGQNIVLTKEVKKKQQIKFSENCIHLIKNKPSLKKTKTKCGQMS